MHADPHEPAQQEPCCLHASHYLQPGTRLGADWRCLVMSGSVVSLLTDMDRYLQADTGVRAFWKWLDMSSSGECICRGPQRL